MNTYLNYKIKGLYKYNNFTENINDISKILEKNIKEIKKDSIKLIDESKLEKIKIILDNDEYIEMNYKDNIKEARIFIKLQGINNGHKIEEYIKKKLKAEKVNLEVNYSYN